MCPIKECEVRVIKAAFEFLAKIINFCNKELGTPFERCSRVFENAIIDCNAKLGPLFNWLCSITYIVKSVCYLVKFLDFICMLVDFISDSVIGVVIRKVKTFIRHIRTMFYVRIKFSHSFQFQTSSSKSMAEVAHGIVAEIKDRTRFLMALYDFMTSAATLFFLFIVFKVIYYRFRFLTSEKFDNIYITKDFRNLDMRRAKLGRETVLPLNNREMEIYIPANSKRLAKSEKKALSKAVATLATASLKLAIIILTDYCLFWILNLIKYYGRFQSKVQAPNVPTAYISGTGLLADLLRGIVKAFQPVGIQLEIDTVPCLPTPIPPDYDCYVQIVTVILLCWILTVLSPYGLRLRHTAMCYYHPMRAKERAIWLYNHIMRSRNSFLKFARRQLRRKIKGEEGIEKITCKEYLSANFRICRLCLGEGVQTACLLCGKIFRESDEKKPIRCSTPGCPGVYCEQCFSDLQNLCTICLSPIQYGDLSDISEEKDSSEEEPKQWKAEDKSKRKRKWWCCKWCSGDQEEEDTKTKKRSLPSIKEYGSEDGETKAKLLEDTSSADEQDETEVDGSEKQDRGEKPKDSDYYSSDSATDYSYSYQYDKSQDETQPKTTSVPFKDVEKQEIPDYATMETFRVEIENDTAIITPSKDIEAEDLPNYETLEDITEEMQIAEIKEEASITTEDVEDQVDETELQDEEEIVTVQKSAGTVISGTTLEQNKRGRHIDFIGVPSKSKVSLRKKPKRRKKEKEEEIPLLASEECMCSDTDDTDLMPAAALLKSTTSTTTNNLPPFHSTSTEGDKQPGSTSNVPNSEVKDVQTEVPRLDFSGLTEPISKRSYIEEKFSDVIYEEISESPKSTSSGRNLTSSTNISSLKASIESPVDSAEICECETKLSVGLEEPSIDEGSKLLPEPSPSSADSYTLESNQRQRVKQYYKAVKEVPSKKVEEQRKPNRFMKFIQKICSKRKKNLDDLPLYSTDKEIIELKSYNYCQGHWDTLSSSSSADIDKLNSETPEEPRSSDEEEKGKRIRGGESGLVKGTNRILRRNRLKGRAKRNTSDYTALRDLPNSSVKPYESVTEDLLSKYFVSLEELTPTRDCGTPMTTVEPLKPTYGTSDLLTEEVPEKEQTLLSPVASLAGTGINQISAEIPAAPRSKVDERSREISRSSQQSKDLNRKPCKCKAPPSKDQELQTTFPRPIIKITPRSDNSLITIKDSSITSQTSQSFTEPETIGPNMLNAPDRNVSADKRLDTGEKYPVKDSSHDVASKHSQKILLTSNKMQQTSNEGIHQLELPVKPTTSSNRATAGSNTNSTNARSSSTNRHSTCLETTETIDPTSSSNLCCECRCAKLDAANNEFSYKCCKCAAPPPPPRHDEYFSLQDKCCRSTSPPQAYPKCVTYADRRHRCCRDVPSELSIRSGRRKVYRDFPENDDYPCCEKQYTEFKRTPCDECASEASRRIRPLESDRQRRQSPGTGMTSPCNGDCRCCAKNRKSRQPPISSCRYRPIERCSSSSDISDDMEDDDGDSYFSDGPPNRFDLPYQDNDEYLELVQELEETLQSRNRNRVRRAMQEFEHRSRYNKPLDQPIINYDETSESEEPIIEKLSKLTSGKCYRCCEGEMCTCRRRTRQPFGKKGLNKAKEQRPRSRGGCPYATRCRQKPIESSARTHWQLDKSSGEWYKVSENPPRRRSQRRSRTPSPQRDYCPYNCNCCGARGYDYR